MIKILHTADWHIGTFNSPETNGENGRYLDLCAALDKLCEGAEAENPDFILFSGDMFHAAKTWSDRGLKENQKAVEVLRRLAAVAPVVVLRGTPSHDSEQQYQSLKSTFSKDSRVIICTEPTVQTVWNATTGKKIRVAALPGFDKGYFRAKNPGLPAEEENRVFSEALKDLVLGMNAEKTTLATVLMAHYTVVGSNMASGQTALFEKFEPVLYPEDITNAEYDLVCLGHIHRPQNVPNVKNVAERENAFYCGSLTQLNFNDESQQHGYYVHYLEEVDIGSLLMRSEFKALPSREFMTIRLTDTDIAAFNEVGDLVIDVADAANIAGKIVRVIYTCTDEHNKALNKTLLERKLIELGAWFVQEITPEEILVTAVKKSLCRDSTPEENLAAYLAEKHTPDDEAASLIELARPIIAEAAANTGKNVNAGLFVPLEISVHNYRNYRDETFSFENISFCTINGSNGVGKSSLFMDAMIDALFEEPREGDLTGWISNDEEARSGSIQLTFALGDKKYRVTRTRAKSGKATLNLAEYVEGEWQDRSREKLRDTQAAITETLGMDSLTIKACALIMQDQYGLFLQADKESRMNVLGNILGLKAYEKMEQLASERATEVNREIRLAMERVNEKTANAPNVEELEAEESKLESHADALKHETAEKRFIHQTLSEVVANQKDARSRASKHWTKINAIATSIANKQSAINAQKAIVVVAEKTLEQRETIEGMSANLDDLLEMEKVMLTEKAAYKAATERLEVAAAEKKALEKAISDREQERAKLTAEMQLSEAKLARERQLIEGHADYQYIQAEVEKLKALKAEVDKLTAEYNAACKAVEQERALITVEKEKWLAKITDTEKKIALLTSDCGCLDIEKAQCKFLKDAIEAREKLPEYKAKVEETESSGKSRLLDLENARLKALKAVNEKTLDEAKLSALEAKLVAPSYIEQERAYAELDIVKATYEAQGERDALLKKTIEEQQSRLAALSDEISALTKKADEQHFNETEYRTLLTTIETAKMWREKAKEIPLAEERKRVAEERIAELTEEVTRLTAEKDEHKSSAKTLEEKAQGYGENEEKLKILGEAISDLESQTTETAMKLGEVGTKIKSAAAVADEIAQLNTQIKDRETAAARYDKLKVAFSQDGIPHNIVRSIIPTLEATASSILGQMSGGKMSVEIVTEKTLKSNSKKEVTTLDVVINDVNTGRLPYLSRSGGERVKAALSVILALSEIKSTKAGIQLGFLFIDEPPFLDAEGVQAYCDALEAIQRRYSSLKVMAITHDPSMKARFPQSIDVVKTAAGSKVL